MNCAILCNNVDVTGQSDNLQKRREKVGGSALVGALPGLADPARPLHLPTTTTLF